MPRLLTRSTPSLDTPFGINRESMQARGLVGWWPTIGATAGALRGHAGAGAAMFTVNAPELVGDPAVGRALLLNGSSHYAFTGAKAIPTFLQTTPFSVSFWFASTDADGGIIRNWDAGVSPGWFIDLNAGSIRLIITNAGASAGRMARTTSTALGGGAMTHAVVTYDGSSSSAGILIYINGVAMGMTSILNTSPGTLVDHVVLVGSSGAFYAGRLADFRVHDRVIPAQEAGQMFAPQTRWQLYRPSKWRTIIPTPATAGVAQVTGFSRLAGQGAKGSFLTVSLYGPSRLAGAGAKATMNTAEVRAPGRFATAAFKGGLAVAALNAAGRQATAFVKGGLTTLAQRAAGLLVSAGVHAGTGTSSARASGLLAITGVHAGAATAALRSSGRLAALSSTARSVAAAITAPARIALQAAKASTATASERAPARMGVLASTARSAAALLTALGSQVASSVPTFSQGAAFVARARMAASGVKGSLSTAAQMARATLAAPGLKAATGQGQLSGSARVATDTRRDAFAVVVLRAQPSLSVVGVVGRAGSVALYARGRGGVVVSVALQHGSLELLDRLVGGLDVVDRRAGGMDASDRSVGGLEVLDR